MDLHMIFEVDLVWYSIGVKDRLKINFVKLLDVIDSHYLYPIFGSIWPAGKQTRNIGTMSQTRLLSSLTFIVGALYFLLTQSDKIATKVLVVQICRTLDSHMQVMTHISALISKEPFVFWV